MWSSVAASWEEQADYVDEHTAHMTERMLELTAPEPRDRILELACGGGGLGLAAAARVAPEGEVVISDVAVEMATIARRRADARGLTNVRTKRLDLEEIDEPDASYDVALCREGLMLTADPFRAAAEVHRILAPGGRVALSVWGPRERNPWLGSVLDAVGDELGQQFPPPGLPGPFALDGVERLRAPLEASGLVELAIEEVEIPRRATSFDDWWARTSALAGPLARLLANLPPDIAEGVQQRARAFAEPYTAADGAIEFPGVALLASARRAA
jgi:enediyne biosynthesis protein CalE5